MVYPLPPCTAFFVPLPRSKASSKVCLKNRPASPSLNGTEEELLRLRLRIKELESQLYHAEMARDAYDYMIDLAEQRYHTRVRKNSDAK